jgi:arginyl-tRNA synthetase
MIEQILLEKTCDAVKELYGQAIAPELIGFEKTKKEIEGDFTIVVFPLTRYSKKSPEVTAQEIGRWLQGSVGEIKDYNIIKGFLNIILSESFWLSFLVSHYKIKDYGYARERNQQPVLVEYSSPNTNKPLHLGHIRNNLLGFSLSEILKANGYKVIKVNLINDRGIHICKSMLAYMKWGNGETPVSAGMKGDHLVGKYYVMFDKYHKEEIKDLMEKGQTEEEAAKQAPIYLEAQEILRKWEARDRETLELWKLMNSWVYEGFDVTYNRLGVNFDLVQYESGTYISGKELVTEGYEKGYLVRKPDGSICADLTNEGLDEKVLLRADGTSVYMTQDLGTAQMRYNDYHPSQMIYVVGNEQDYHFDVLKIVLQKLGKDWSSKIYHLSYGMVELPHGKMKSREGTVVDADDLLDEMFLTAEETTRALGKVDEFSEKEAKKLFAMIGLGALKYFILKVDPRKNMLFDPKESIDFNGNTGPFIQYTHARIQSLLNKASGVRHPASGIRHPASGIRLQASEEGELQRCSLNVPERNIIKFLYQFPQIVSQAGTEFSPARIANYVYDLAREYNQFYQEVPVIKEEDPAKRNMRLVLSAFTGDIIRRCMALLGIEVPDRM